MPNSELPKSPETWAIIGTTIYKQPKPEILKKKKLS